MKPKTINIITAIVTILQAILLSLPSISIDPIFHKWLMIGFAGAILVFNGALQNFKTPNPMLIISIISFVGFVAGGVVDYVDAIPNLSEVAKTNILTITTLIVTISNIFCKTLNNLLSVQSKEE